MLTFQTMAAKLGESSVKNFKTKRYTLKLAFCVSVSYNEYIYHKTGLGMPGASSFSLKL